MDLIYDSFFSNSVFYLLGYFWQPFNFPELGVKGAAIGTLIATIWGVFHYTYYLFKKNIKQKYKVFINSVDFQMLKKQLIISYPLAIQEFLVMLSLTAFYKIIAIIGIIELAATQIIFKIMHTSFMPAIGIGQACATLVGKYLGEENSNKAELSIYESIRGSLYIMGVMGLIFIIFSESIVSIFIKDISVIKLAAPGLKFIGFLQFIDAFCFTLWFALTGAMILEYQQFLIY